MSGPTTGNPLGVCGAVVATCIGKAMKRRIQNLSRAAAIDRNLIKRHIEAAAMRKQNCRKRAHQTLKGSSRRKFFKFTSPDQSFEAALRQYTQTPATKGTAGR
jgi:hypothetical protein